MTTQAQSPAQHTTKAAYSLRTPAWVEENTDHGVLLHGKTNTGGNGIYMNTNSSGSWTGLILVPGMKTNAALASVFFAGRIFLFAKSENNHCFFNSLLPSFGSQAWQSWQEVPGEVTIIVPLHASVMGGYLYLFTKGVNNSRIHFNRLNTAFTWSGWIAVTGNFTTNTAVVSCKDPVHNRLWVFARDMNNKVFYNQLTATNDGRLSWSGWLPHPPGGSINTALAVTSDSRTLYLFGKGISNRIFYSSLTTPNRWSDWQNISEDRPTDLSVVVTGRERSKFIIFCKGINDNRIYMNQQSP